METAINIAYASKLLRPIDQLLTANCDSKVSADVSCGDGQVTTDSPAHQKHRRCVGGSGMAGAFLLPLSLFFL